MAHASVLAPRLQCWAGSMGKRRAAQEFMGKGLEEHRGLVGTTGYQTSRSPLHSLDAVSDVSLRLPMAPSWSTQSCY